MTTRRSAFAGHSLFVVVALMMGPVVAGCASDASTDDEESNGGESEGSTTEALAQNPTPRMIAVRETLKANFNIPMGIGCVRADSIPDHPSGLACDFMMASGTKPTAANAATGDKVAAWAKDNAKKYGVQYVIWKQHIWNIARDAEGWRAMADRGGITANHFDHVHITVAASGPVGPLPAAGAKPAGGAAAPPPAKPGGAPAPPPPPPPGAGTGGAATVGVSVACFPGGKYCGTDKVLGERDTLYVCNSDGQGATVAEKCATACTINPSPSDDACQ